MRRFVILLVFSLAAATATAAPVRYVSDELVITMRTGKGNKYEILEQLRSGTRLEVLGQDGTYTRVRTPKGEEGWVLTRFLSNSPIARHKLARAEKSLQQLRKENRSLEEQLRNLRNEKGELEQQRTQLSGEKNKVAEELENLRKLAARPAQLDAENQRMKAEIGELNAEMKRLGDANAALKDRSKRDWFLTGAGVLGGGIVLGLVLPLLRRRKKSGFDLR